MDRCKLGKLCILRRRIPYLRTLSQVGPAKRNHFILSAKMLSTRARISSLLDEPFERK